MPDGGATRSTGRRPADRRGRLIAVLTVLALVVGYAAGSTFLTSLSPTWYEELNQPWFQPPDVVFGVIWPVNFIILAIVGTTYCWREPPSRSRPFTGLFAVSAACSLGWAYLFYVPHLLWPAAISLLGAALLTWLLLVAAARSRPWSGALLVVYAGWLSLATVLAFAYAVSP